MYRCAIIGCGPRAKGHAEAYKHVRRGKLIAICDIDRERLDAFGDQFDIDARYEDIGKMIEAERPDLVHIVTQPTLRVPLMSEVASYQVPAAIVEKPICIGADDYKALRELEEQASTKFVVNHQLRHHPRMLELFDYVWGGGIGEVRFIEASSGLPLAGQGVHAMDLIFAFNQYAPAAKVFGASYGYDDINGAHPSPRSSVTLIGFENGVRAVLQCGADSPRYDTEGRVWMNKRISVFGTKGFVHWRMNGWERTLPDGTVERGEHEYREEDVIGQANLTEAVFSWLEAPARPHPNNLRISLDQWLVILGHYMSTIEQQSVDLPFDPPDNLLDMLKEAVESEAAG